MKPPKKVLIYQGGVSLIELMISITIGVVILGAILAVYSATSSTGKQSETATRMSEDAAVAMNYMAGYIRMAGFSFPQANVPVNTAVSGTGTVQVNDSNFAGAGVRGCDAGFSNPTVSTTLSLTCNSGTGTAAISVRFEGDAYNTGPSGVNPTDCLSQAVTAATSSDFSGGPTYSLVESRFYVKTGANSGTPELYCGGSGGGSNFVAQPIMQYVESLVFTYGVADDVSSQLVTSYLTAAGVDLLPGSVDQRWSRVVSVKVCLVMRSEMPDQNTPGSYINCAGNSVASTDRFLRKAFRSVVTLRNRGALSS
ncbi:Type IV Pilus-assembly protein W [compost metagenome]